MKNTGWIDYKNMKKFSRLFHSHLNLLMEKWPLILIQFFLSFAGDPSNDRRGHLLLRWVCLLVLSAVEFRFVHLFLNI